MIWYTRVVSKQKQRELCLACRLPDCDTASQGCGIKREINRIQRERYHKHKEKSREKRRKAAIPADQYERKKEYMRKYYKQNRDVILMKQKLRDKKHGLGRNKT